MRFTPPGQPGLALDVANDAIAWCGRIASVDRATDFSTEPGAASSDGLFRRAGYYFGLGAVVVGPQLTILWAAFLAWCAFRLLGAILFLNHSVPGTDAPHNPAPSLARRPPTRRHKHPPEIAARPTRLTSASDEDQRTRIIKAVGQGRRSDRRPVRDLQIKILSANPTRINSLACRLPKLSRRYGHHDRGFGHCRNRVREIEFHGYCPLN
jgi:hypothetical protein